MTNQFTKQIAAIVQKIKDDFWQTPEDERYFSLANIEKCEQDLTHFLTNIAQNSNAKHQQDFINEQIYQLCLNLATFDEVDGESEYLYGFLYNGYTVELTTFIREVISAYGFHMPTATPISTNVFSMRYSPSCHYRYYDIYLGSDNSQGIKLTYNFNDHCFYYDENPYGDAYPLPIFNLTSNADFSEFSFEVLSQGCYIKYLFLATSPSDTLWFKMIMDLHGNTVFLKRPPLDFCDIEFEMIGGAVYELHTTNRDSQGRIISMYTQGSGVNIFVMDIDNKGQMHSPYSVINSNIAYKKFFMVHAVPDWKRFEVDFFELQGNMLKVVSKNQMTCHDKNHNEITKICSPQSYHYPIKTYEFLLQFLQNVLALKKPLSQPV